jgi:hypothetical protein
MKKPAKMGIEAAPKYGDFEPTIIKKNLGSWEFMGSYGRKRPNDFQ